MPSFILKGNEWKLKSVTSRELYKVIDKIPSQKSAGPGYIPTWALKNCKLSIGFQLQFAIDECLNTNTLPDILKKPKSFLSVRNVTDKTLKTNLQFQLL